MRPDWAQSKFVMVECMKPAKLTCPELENAIDRMVKARTKFENAEKNAGAEAPASERREEVCEKRQDAQQPHSDCTSARPAIRATTLDAALVTRKGGEK